MNFITDKQTLEDLNITGKYKSGSLFSFFNKVKTSGGEKLLESMFHNPLTDAGLINQRSKIFSYFQQQEQLEFPFSRKLFDVMENYLSEGGAQHLLMSYFGNFKKQVLAATVRDDQYARMQEGVRATVTILKTCRDFFLALDVAGGAANAYSFQIEEVKSLFSLEQLAWLADNQQEDEMTSLKWSKYDHLLKYTLRKELGLLMEIINHLDVYMAVGQLARLKGFTYAIAQTKDQNLFNAVGIYHPLLTNAIGNAVSFDAQKNVIFMTGANMAGKSTLMKAIGISLYLAHMGFPVAAESVEFSVKDGIYSSINVPDNLNLGLSHFYAEVLRVKKVAEEVSSGKALLVIFDELFKGTNVKDAYDATLAVTKAFAEYPACCYVISTHIIEVGEALNGNNRVQFLYLPTVMEGKVPRYTYKLKQGITADRHGMVLIENEGILEL